MTTPRMQGCIFCTLYRQDDQRAALVLAQTSHSVVMMNKYPYNNGHLLLAPKRHENNPDKLPSEEFIDLNEALRRSIEIVRSAFHPGGINSGDESRQVRRRWDRGSSALAHRAALGRGYQFYARHRRDACDATAFAR